MFHPWRRMRDLGPSWTLRWAHLPADTYGVTDHARKLITLQIGMSYAERRCTIAHEVEHALRGPVSAAETAREELEVDRAVAIRLLPSVQAICDALVWHRGDYEEASDDLSVDPLILEVRISALVGAERDYYNQRLAEVRLGPAS